MEAEMKIVEDNKSKEGRVHHVLAHSYVSYFVLFLVGVCLDIIFRYKIFTNPSWTLAGIILLVFGSFIVFWAQRTSRNLKTENLSKETFCRGPYYYTRSPTHWGLFFLVLGFGILANAFFVVLLTLFSFIITKFIFVDRQEKILEKKYGTHYSEYKKQVKL